MKFVLFLPEARYGTEFKLYVYLILLENQKVIHCSANRAQPVSHKLSSDVTGMVLLAGDLLSMGGTYIASLVVSCFDGRI